MSFERLSFTGQSGCYGELPLAVLAGVETFTIEVKLSTASTKNVTATSGGHPRCWEMGTIFGREISGFGRDDGGLVVNNGKLIFWASPASKGTGASNTQVVSSDAVVNDGAIHKVAVVSSDGAINLYCDDVLVAHADNINAKISNVQTILLGYNTNNNSYLQMDLYEARFWSVARTQAELFTTITGNETGLQGWYLPSADGLKDYSGNNYHATLYGSPAYNDTMAVSFDGDIELDIHNDALLAQSLVAWLPFDTSTTLDKCGNTWTATGSPTISEGALQLNGASYLQMTGGITLGGQDFTIRGKFNMSSDSGASCRILSFHNANQTTTNCINLARYRATANLYADCMSSTSRNVAITLNQTHDFEFNYYHDISTVKIFIDGVLGITLSNKNIPRTTFANVFINKSNWSADGYFVGSIDEFQIYDGIALHNDDFTPPTTDDYIALALALDGQVALDLPLDVSRQLSNAVDVLVDVKRNVQKDYSVDYALDVQRNVRHSLELSSDVKRNLNRSYLADLDCARNVILSVDVIADVLRNVLARINFAPTDNSQYFSGIDSQTPVVIPSQPALLPGDTNGAQSFELSLSEQQLTDQLKVTSVTPLHLLQRLKGQYLDYQYDMRIERGSKQGIVYSADCFINIDEILYTPLNYDMPAAQVSVWYTENQAYQRQLYPLASQHVAAIAAALGLQPVMQFDDFYSLVEVEAQKENGGTYADLIREIFGWSSRVPTQLINAYIRDGKLYVIQRGHEAHLIDLTNAKMTMPIVTHELMRTYYQRRKFSTTETREVKRRRINHTNSSTEIHSGGNTISNYGYDNSGLLDHTVTTTTNSDGETVRTETDYDYVTLQNGEKVLVKETTKKYVDGSLEETTETKHTPLKQGLSHQVKIDEDGDIISEGVGQNSSDDRVTPYSEFRDDPSGEYETYQEYIDIDGLSLIDTSFPIQNVIRENFTNSPYPILGLTEEERMSVDTAKGHGRLKALTEEIKRLNLKTKETVNVTIYNYPHLIDFNDRILFNANEYFLVSNTAKTIPRLFNSQSLTFVRWF